MDANAFQHAINLGLGRAHLLLKQDPTAYDAVLIDACLHNKSHDAQVEGSRAEYLLELMEASGSFSAVSQTIIDSLTGDAEGWDFWQRFRLTRMLAQRGDQQARTAMQVGFMRNHADMRGQLSEELVELDGIDGLLAAARQIGTWMEAADGAWDDDGLIDLAGDTYGKEAVEFALNNAAKSDRAIQTYVFAVEEHRSASNSISEPDRVGLSYLDIQELIASGKAAGVLARWSKTASESDLLAAAQDLVKEHDLGRLRSYLLIFRNQKFPLPPDRLFELSEMPDGPIPRHSLRVLANISDTRVRELAFTLVNSRSDLRSFAIDLLAHNFLDGDHDTIEAWFALEGDSDILQGLNLDLLKFYKLHPNPESEARLLERIYDRLPCAHCRCSLVERLLEMGRLRDSLRLECEHDSYLETRTLVEKSRTPNTAA
jgi:hypothetical protein